MDLECSFSVDFNQNYRCDIDQSSLNKTREVRVYGDHVDGKSDQDVQLLIGQKKNLEKFPRGIGLVFPNMTTLLLQNCGIKWLTCEDFGDLGRLERIYLHDNQIQELGEDVFTHLGCLRLLELSNNLINSIHPKAFDPLKSLEDLRLRRNVCINKDWNNLMNDENRFKMMTEIAEYSAAVSQAEVHEESRILVLETRVKCLELLFSKMNDEKVQSLVKIHKLLETHIEEMKSMPKGAFTY